MVQQSSQISLAAQTEFQHFGLRLDQVIADLFPDYSRSKLKEWIDQVFEYGFAFGTGSKLANKNVIVSMTIGSGKKDYPQEVLDKILFPFQGLAAYCKMNYIGEVLSNNINNYTPEAAEKAKVTAKEHAEKLLSLINK